MIEGRNLWELIERRAADTPDGEMALDEEGRTLTFGEYRDRVERVAAGLAAEGIGEGDVVSWQLPTWFESMVLVAALSRLGAVQNPIIPIYREREVGFCTRQAGSKLLIVPGTFAGFDFEAMANGIAADVDGLEVMVVDRSGDHDLPEADPSSLPAAADPPDDPGDLPVRWLFYTSGTTADPKGARHTDASVAAIAKGMCERYRATPEDRGAMVFPFTHIGGITWLFASLQSGSVNLFVEAFNPQTTVPFLAENGVTLAGAGTPFHMVYLAAQRQQPDTPLFPNVRAFPGGGAPKPPRLHYDLMAEMGGVGILSGYGLTEAPILTLVDVDDSDEAKANTEGKPMPGVDLRIVSMEDGALCGPGQEGEIRAKAPQLMQGYLDSSLDADAFDDDGYFRTGDLGMQDDEGNLTITGRVKDIIIRNMENISAKEVEDLLYTHDKVADVAVIGLPSAKTGEMVCAVVASDGDEDLTFDEMVEHLTAQGLRKQALPERLEIVDAVPRNPTGKIVKFELVDRYS